MGNRQLAATLLTLFLVGCGTAPSNQPAPVSNFSTTDPTGTLAQTPDTTTADPTYADDTDPSLDPAADPAADPSLDPSLDPTADPSPSPSPSADPVIPIMDNSAAGGGGDQVIPLKNSIFKDWQATGIVAVDGQIYIAASDRTGLSRRGSALTLDAKGSWKDIGDKLLGLTHPLNSTVRGIAADTSGNLLVVEASGKVGLVTTSPKPSIKAVSTGQSGVLDVVCYSNSFFISTGTQIRKMSPDLATSESIAANLSLTGGMGVDKDGNFYCVATGQIVKIDQDGVSSVVLDNVMNAVDVAIAKDGRMVVLMNNGISVYDASGQKLKDIGGGEIGTGAAIYVDASNTIYVADTGKDRKSSQILTYSL